MRRWLRALFIGSFMVAALSFVAGTAGAQDGGSAGGETMLLPGVRLAELIGVVVYGLVGLMLSILGYVVFEKVAPYPVRKEIEEDQNIALGIVIGSVIISIAIVVSSAIHE